ncbi:Phosphoribosylglycinamide formyltransferase [Candidatus Nitrosotalea sp. TS]|nr:Phosphoribosylglycinamide formyltransferase [Candidatus Nitrosotalea sp. TS]
MKNLAILISGRGSNMEAILRAVKKKKIPVHPAVVISNKPNARRTEDCAKTWSQDCNS